MTNKERQNAIEKRHKRKYGELKCKTEVFCCYCKKELETPCAKAYNRMVYESYKPGTERERYSWGDF